MKSYIYYSRVLVLLVFLLIKNSLLAETPRVALQFGNGLNIEDVDSSMSLNIGVMMQNRLDVSKVFQEGTDPYTALQVRRMRLKFKGYFLHNKFDYNVQLSVIPSDIKAGNLIYDAFIRYKPIKQFQIQFGQGKLPGDREEITSAERQFLVDRSTTNSLFKLDRDFGVQFFGNFGKKFIVKPRFSIASGEGKNYNALDVQHFSYTTRIDFLPTGEFSGGGDYTFQDLAREVKPKFALSTAYDFNNKAVFNKGSWGGTIVSDSLRHNIHSFYLDAILKYQGFTTTQGYVYRNAGENTTKYIAGQSFYITASYLSKKKLEVGARFNRSFAGNYGNIATMNEYTVGLAYYISKNAAKVLTDYTLTDNKTTGIKSGNWRFQMQLAF